MFEACFVCPPLCDAIQGSIFYKGDSSLRIVIPENWAVGTAKMAADPGSRDGWAADMEVIHVHYSD